MSLRKAFNWPFGGSGRTEETEAVHRLYLLRQIWNAVAGDRSGIGTTSPDCFAHCSSVSRLTVLTKYFITDGGIKPTPDLLFNNKQEDILLELIASIFDLSSSSIKANQWLDIYRARAIDLGLAFPSDFVVRLSLSKLIFTKY